MARLKATDLSFIGLGPMSFELPAGSLTALSGPSGAGKSRLLRALVDLDPHQGQIRLDDEDQQRIPAPRWRQRVGLLPAEPRFWLPTGAEHLKGDDPDKQQLGQKLGLSPQLLAQSVKRFSSGERQRLGLLRLLLLGPEVLLLDEPTANLDPDSALAVERLVSDYAEQTGACVLWVGHDPEQMQRLCSRHLHLENGCLEQRR